ncbi:MAG: M20/M25/M40 family metallo-hydrolase [Acidobacteriota bacterium]|nr:M20/M25/M40 family metallo-hydrolase [Acidobacteriota bacterium]
MRGQRWLAAVAVLTLAAVGTVRSQAAMDGGMIAKIRTEGLEHSQVARIFHTITTRFGGRLTGSPAQKAASTWARDQLREFGLSDARLEPWRFGRGWELKKLTVEMVAPRYMPLIGYAEGWSASTAGDITGTPVYLGDKTAADIPGMAAQIKGAIVLSQPEQTTFVVEDRYQPTVSADPSAGTAPRFPYDPARVGKPGQAFIHALHDAGVGAVIKPSPANYGSVFVLGRDEGADAVPSIVMAAEQYNLILRMLKMGLPVKLHVDVQAQYYDDPDTYNVIAEIPGTDPALKDQVVMIGAHLDSWHSATGSADNADGAAEVMEAMRILKAVGARPRRTIRVGIWSGEEQGLLGSKAYVAQHLAGPSNKAARDNFDVYLNTDAGRGWAWGFYMENDPQAKALFDQWLEPFRDLGARRNVIQGIGATDHLSFLHDGMAGFNAIRDYRNYDQRIHHTNMDMDERVSLPSLKEAAIVLAAFAYDAAMIDQKIPLPPAAAAAAGGR